MRAAIEGPIAVIGAMSVEIEYLLSIMTQKLESIQGRMVFYSGILNNTPCVAAVCGAGKVNAAAYTQAIIAKFKPRLVINIGVAGGIAPDVHIGDLVVADSCIQYDYDISALEADRLPGDICISGKIMTQLPCDNKASYLIAKSAAEIYDNVLRGVIVTGDSFIADSKKCQSLHESFHALACEMEGGSIAHVCHMNNLPVVVLRAISDNANDIADIDFPTFAAQTAKKTQKILSETIC